MYIDHPLIKESSIIKREYQSKIVELMKSSNLLIVLPTGTGKTTIALLYVADLLLKGDRGVVIFVAPTRPLTKQHYEYFREHLKIDDEDMAFITGEYPPSKRRDEWKKKIIFSTPQVLYNDLIKGWISPGDIGTIIFDEAHHGVGDHPYAKIMRFISFSKVPHVIGLTASPGDVSKTASIMNNLRLSDIYVLTKEDYELKRYLPPVKMMLVKSSPDKLFYHVISLIVSAIEERLNILNEALKEHLVFNLNYRSISFSRLSDIREKVEELYMNSLISLGERRKIRLVINELMILDRLLTYVESYGYRPFMEYYGDILERASYKRRRVEKNIVYDKNINEAYLLVNKAVENNYPYPKLEALKRVLKENNKGVLIFVGLKSMATHISQVLNRSGYRSDYLIGQSPQRGGMSQREQIKVIDRFRNQDIDIMIATHIGEEGLDISECKAVIFYDNPISAIRRIQRAGRTGRTLPGKIFFVVNPNTRDESRYWAGIRKEKKLLSELKLLSDAAKEVSLEKYIHEVDEQEPMEHFATIKIDHRERIDEIIHYLREKKIKIELAELPIGDYVIGNILIERKKYGDLASSIIDGRIFNQLKTLASGDYVPLIILEGDKSSFIKRLNEGALNGIILTILIDFKIPIYYSKNELDTAKMLYSLIKRYVEKKHPPPTRLERRPLSLRDIQKFVVAGLPDVDTVLADRLLRHFRTIENVFTASEDELIKVKGIGAKIAKKIRKVLTSDYLSADTSKTSDLV